MSFIEDFEKTIKEMDLILRPEVIFLNPEDAKVILSAFPRIEEEYEIVTLSYLERGKAYVFKRKDLEDWKFCLMDGDEV